MSDPKEQILAEFDGCRAVINALIPLIDREAHRLVQGDPDLKDEKFHSDFEVFMFYLVMNGIEDRELLEQIARWWKQQRSHAIGHAEDILNKFKGRQK
jgi:hypothetical protein